MEQNTGSAEYREQIRYLQNNIGFEAFSKFTKTLMDPPQCYNDLLLAYRKYLSKLAGIDTDSLVDTYANILVEMCDLRVLPICVECGYYADEVNNAREYYCLLVDSTIVPTLEREFETDQRFTEYIIDANTEVDMRIQERTGEYDRKTVGVTISHDYDYYNCMMLRYPLEDIRYLPAVLFEEITRDYIIVHICDREIGKNTRLAAFIISILHKICEWSK